jgi:HEAT repeat protein
LGILLLIPVHFSKAEELDAQELSKAIESERWRDRVAALRIMQDKQIDVATFGTYQKMRSSPHVAERYLLARALRVSRKPEAYDDLIAFLDDPNPNVVSMAFYALGKKGNRRAIKEIMKRIEASESWYNQWYAYKALRNLGWKQTRSKQRR